MAQGTYRAIVVFDAPDAKAAKLKAENAAKAAQGKLDRLTIRRETWGPVQDDDDE